VTHHTGRVGQPRDEHVLGQPTVVAGHCGRDPQGEALLAQQSVAAVPGSVRDDLAVLREVRDVLDVAARPRRVGLAFRQGSTHTVQSLDEGPTLRDEVERGLTHPRHDLHGDGDVGRVGDLHAELRYGRADRPHGEREHVHRPAAHGAGQERSQGRAHLRRVGPVVRRPGVVRLLAADEGAVLDPRHVRRVRTGQEAVRAQRRVQPDQGAFLDEFVGQTLPLRVGSVAPDDTVRQSESGHLSHPRVKL
jgi:hypothetical protein